MKSTKRQTEYTADRLGENNYFGRRSYLPGSYTIEASILISVILLILMTWFYLAFSFHDRLVCRALALFYTEAAGRMMEEPISEEGRLEIERLNERSGILIGTYASRINPSVLEERFLAAADGLLLISRPETVRSKPLYFRNLGSARNGFFFATARMQSPFFPFSLLSFMHSESRSVEYPCPLKEPETHRQSIYI